MLVIGDLAFFKLQIVVVSDVPVPTIYFIAATCLATSFSGSMLSSLLA